MMTGRQPPKSPSKMETISGFVSDVSPIKTSRNKRPYFEFKVNTTSEEKRSVCFSPEKRKLLNDLSTEENGGCEISNFKRSDNGDLLVTNFSSIKRVKLNFERIKFEQKFSTVAEILNEHPMFKIVNVKVTIYDLKAEEEFLSNGKKLKFRKAMAKDSSGCMPITFFCDLNSVVENKKAYIISGMRISSFQNNRVLKTTEDTKITIDENSKVVLTQEDTRCETEKVVEGIIVSVDLKTFSVRYFCPECKCEKKVDNLIIFCEDCQIMTDISHCKNAATVEFTLKSGNEVLKLKCSFNVLRDGFDDVFKNLTTNLEMARAMIHTNAKVVYNTVNMNVIEIILEDKFIE